MGACKEATRVKLRAAWCWRRRRSWLTGLDGLKAACFLEGGEKKLNLEGIHQRRAGGVGGRRRACKIVLAL